MTDLALRPNDLEFSGEAEGAQRAMPSPLQRRVRPLSTDLKEKGRKGA